MNVVVIKGRLTRDPEIRYTQGDKPMSIARFSLAVNRRFKRDGDPDADFFNVVAFGKQAETIEKFVTKGTEIAVRGHLQTGSYQNKEGQTVRTVDVVLDEFDFCGSKASNGGGQNTAKPFGGGNPFQRVDDVNDEELPFN